MNQLTGIAPKVLITSDQRQIRTSVTALLMAEGFEPQEAASGRQALQFLRQESYSVVVLDLSLPDMCGLAVLREIRSLDRGLPVILVLGGSSSELALKTVEYEAFAYLTEPLRDEELVLTLRLAVAQRQRKGESRLLDLRSGQPSLAEAMGSSEAIRRVVADVERVAPTNFTVVITGETGVGKELVAKAIHRLSSRRGEPFVPLDCGSIPATLMESELFGHEKGAFTGAERGRPGNFEAAHGGTLFFDEIGNLPLAMQAKLLRALQERHVCRLGGNKLTEVDVRVLAATNDDLSPLVAAGRFRRDLYHRLNEFTIVVPPLRQRREDILYLAQRFLATTCRELQKEIPDITPAAGDLLQSYSWPGNVRELRNVMRRAALFAARHISISPEHLELPTTEVPAPKPLATNGHSLDAGLSLREIVRHRIVQTEREVLLQVLQFTGGNQAHAARLLQVDYKTVRTKVKEYGLSVADRS